MDNKFLAKIKFNVGRTKKELNWNINLWHDSADNLAGAIKKQIEIAYLEEELREKKEEKPV